MDKIKIFIGIDQTGAVNTKGRPKPLQVSIIDARKKKIKSFTCLTIEALDSKSIAHLIKNTIGNLNSERVLVCVDSVLGLPSVLKISPERLRSDIKDYSFNGKTHGAITAYNFFKSYIDSEMIPQRKVEVLVRANGVFNLRPFQKNIGCGSYRVLRDLAQEKKWFSVWPYEELKHQFIIAEGYPSFFWKKHLQSKKRSLELIRSCFKHLTFKTMDQADSFVLAFGAMKDYKQIYEIETTAKIRLEGWILGVPYV